MRVRSLVEGADAMERVVKLKRVGKAEVDLAGIDQRDAGAGAARRLHPGLDAAGFVEHFGDGRADRVGQCTLRAGADADRLRLRATGKQYSGGQNAYGNGGETHGILRNF